MAAIAAKRIERKRADLRAMKRTVRWTRLWVLIVLLIEIAVASGFLVYQNQERYKVPSEGIISDA